MDQHITPDAITNYGEEVPLTVTRDGIEVVVGNAVMHSDGFVEVEVTDERMKKLLGGQIDRLSYSITEDPKL